MKTKLINISRPHQMTLDYSIIGEGEPLVFLHGGGATHYDYSLIIDQLSKHFKVYAFTVPGYMQSTMMSPYTVENLITVIDEFTNALELKKFHLMGQSLGGGLAATYTYHHPDKVKRLGLISPLLEEIPYNPITTQLRIRKNSQEAKKFIDNKHKGKRTANSPSIFTKLKSYRIARSINTEPFLSKIQAPTDVFIGLTDIVVPVELQKRLSSLIPNARIIEFEDHGHFLVHSKAKEIAETFAKP